MRLEHERFFPMWIPFSVTYIIHALVFFLIIYYYYLKDLSNMDITMGKVNWCLKDNGLENIFKNYLW